MPQEEKMSVNERRKYLKLVAPRYVRASREERGELLTEMAAITSLHRKSLIRLMGLPNLERAPQQARHRGKRYGVAVADVVRVVWESLDYVCAERLTPVLRETAQRLAAWEELTLRPEVEEALGKISRATVQRLLERFQQDSPQLPRRKPQPPNQLLRRVPMGRLSWQITIPGSFESDLVHHCGTVASGDYVHTLQLVDIATGWSERVAIWGRSQQTMVKGFKKVQERLPFPITHLHPDNGSEFFNDHLMRYFGQEITGLQLSRSRPYQKNDNRFVEQKNNTLVRAYVGYERLDKGCQLVALNALYEQLWLYYNLFQPVMHLVGKEVVSGHLYRKWDSAQTPYQRLLSSHILCSAQEARLAALYTKTNPRELRKAIYTSVARLREYTPSSTQIERKEEALTGNIPK
jgi:hypothetical protein